MARTDKSKQPVADQIRRSSRRSVEPKASKKDSSLLFPSGSTTLNLACSDSPRGAYTAGEVVNVIGDSHTGKTLLVLTMLAEIANNPAFDDYTLRYDDVEHRLHFNIQQMFGKKAEDRIDRKHRSKYVVELFGEINDLAASGKPFVYVVDSLDALTTAQEEDKAKAAVEAIRKGTEAKGSYGMTKAKDMSEQLRIVNSAVEKNNSLVVIVSQTRQNINPMSFTPKVRSGGDALTFYCSHVMWLGYLGKIPRTVNKRKVSVGSHVKVKVTKNSLTGKMRDAEFDTYYDYGVDDIGSCLTFLDKEGGLEEFKKANNIEAKQMSGIISHVEQKNLESRLRRMCSSKWKEIEESLRLDRKPKFK